MNTTTNCPHCGKALSIIRAPVTTGLTHVTAGIPQPSLNKRTAPEASPAKPPAEQTVDPGKLVKCNRCGETDLAWQKSKKGTFYLCRTRKDADGKIYAIRKEFHQCSR